MHTHHTPVKVLTSPEGAVSHNLATGRLSDDAFHDLLAALRITPPHDIAIGTFPLFAV
jgi:hypothetical protein